MVKFDIKKVLDYYKPDISDLAAQLFPGTKYPKQAFDRVIRKEAHLSVNQLETLADFLGVAPSDLFVPDSWKGISDKGHLAFVKGAYKAKINYNNSFVSIYDARSNKLISQHVINNKILTIDELIIYLDNITSNLK